MKSIIVALAASTLLCACANNEFFLSDEDTYAMKSKRVHLAGVSPIFEGGEFELIDLVTLLDPENRGKAAAPVSDENGFLGWFARQEDTGWTQDQIRIAKAFRGFYLYDDTAGPLSLASRRNAIQDRLMGASEQACHAFKNYLSLSSSNNKFTWGSLSTIFGATAAVFSDLETVRALAAAAGISSGIRAEFSQAYMQGLTIDVITRGIDLRRQRIRDEIGLLRGSAVPTSGGPAAVAPASEPLVKPAENNATLRSVQLYSVEQAVFDAVRFHAACSTVVGLQEASESISEVEDPGLRMVKRVFEGLGVKFPAYKVDTGSSDNGGATGASGNNTQPDAKER
jgi:hypothetical protein